MNPLHFLREDVTYLAAKADGDAKAAKELVSFWSENPELAGRAAVEVLALEAKSILSGGAVERVMASSRSGRPTLRQDDLDSVFRLDTIMAISSARLAGLEAALDGEESEAPIHRIGGYVSLAATVLGIVNTIF